MSEDIVGRIVREASQAWPGYEDSSLEVVLRILRAYHFIDQELVRGQVDYGVSPAEFGVLIELRLAGPPYKMTPTQLYNRLLVTSGGMTGRIDRLEKRGLLCRLPDPEDRRSILVELTESGHELIEVAAHTHFRIMEHLTEGLTSEERECLAGLLRKLLVEIEASCGK
ncbi:MAG: MarR family transcriptional regulator [Chloroflexi bacterium]|nr:MarR family transcriptional regulator [Chloroflexota bacterium]